MSKAIKELERQKREEERRKAYKPAETIPKPAAELIDALDEAIRKAEISVQDYRKIANRLDLFGLKKPAAGIILIANDVHTHIQTLRNILRETEDSVQRRLKWVGKDR